MSDVIPDAIQHWRDTPGDIEWLRLKDGAVAKMGEYEIVTDDAGNWWVTELSTRTRVASGRTEPAALAAVAALAAARSMA